MAYKTRPTDVGCSRRNLGRRLIETQSPPRPSVALAVSNGSDWGEAPIFLQVDDHDPPVAVDHVVMVATVRLCARYSCSTRVVNATCGVPCSTVTRAFGLKADSAVASLSPITVEFWWPRTAMHSGGPAGGHYGQRLCEPHHQAEHMAASTGGPTWRFSLP